MVDPADRTSSSPPPSAPRDFSVSPSLSQFQKPLKAYLEANPQFDGIATGALVFDPDGKLLLVQRAVHDSMPNLWEIPGGACDYEDETLLHAVARELWEESGLKAKTITEHVGGEMIFFTRRSRRVCKYTFLVDTEGFDVKLDENEHQRYLWVTEDDAKRCLCGEVELFYTTRKQEAIIYEAFDLRRKKKQEQQCK